MTSRLMFHLRYNSSLILHYCLIAPHLLRPLIHALKLWASAHDLNDPSGARGPATMSSYCLTLMAIGYLQYRGCLPNLQADVNVSFPDLPEETSDPDVIWVGWGKEQGIKAHVGFDKTPPPEWEAREPNLTVADAIRGFFSFFSTMGMLSERRENRFNFAGQAISILNGGILGREHAAGTETMADMERRRELLEEGHSNEAVTQTMMQWRQFRFDQELYMGKGDRGIQPRNWGDRKIVVQDPFLWQKASPTNVG